MAVIPCVLNPIALIQIPVKALGNKTVGFNESS